MSYYLIDFENVKTDGIFSLCNFKPNDKVVIFYSDNCKNISMDIFAKITNISIRFKFIKIKAGVKNALDFHLASYLGYLIGKNFTKTAYFIVSNDKDYNCVCEYWKGKNINVSILSKPVNNQNKLKKAPNNSVKSNKNITHEEITKYISKNEHQKEIFDILNESKSKTEIHSKIQKLLKNNKKSSAIYKKIKPLLKEKKYR